MNSMLVNWNLLVSAVKLVSFEHVTCSFVDVTCSFVSVTCSFVGVTCSFASVTCSFVGVTCSFVGVTCSFDPITFRFAIPKWWILQHIQWRKFSWKKGGKLYEFPKYLFWFCILQLFAFKHKPQTFSRVCLRFITWHLPFETRRLPFKVYCLKRYGNIFLFWPIHGTFWSDCNIGC